MTTFSRAAPGTENGGDYTLDRPRVVHNETVTIDGPPVSRIPLDQDHTDGPRCHRHTKNDVHYRLRRVFLAY